ncbi:hypothetical protein [Brevundimonas sp.]|uniref:hypothetical protein n=1 Tax=Brevundimonas sp. TaxID=1871086 RepID=UPI002D58B4A6|nr:hypothetical protein [Brevundimonas sp.]HYD28906.1 hypothetical protein [Brevundimonas sp.]
MALDPYKVWREAAGQSKQKTVRTIWPALAEALEGPTAGGDLSEDPQPNCVGCGDRKALGRAGDDPVCGRCSGLEPYRSRRLTRVTHWRAG